MQCSPEPQALAAPHWQVEPPQLSASGGSHEKHELPPVPQVETDGLLQSLAASQQPAGQETPSQTQFPPTQSWPSGHTVPLPPHSQTPPDEQLSAAIGSQGAQV